MLSRKATVILLAAVLNLSAQSNRITRRIDPSRRTILQGHVHPEAQPRFDQGPLDPAAQLRSLSLWLSRSPSQQSELEQLLVEQQDPSSPNFHKWLAPGEFGERFGASRSDFDRIMAWLVASGFTIDYVAPARNFVLFAGPADRVEDTFHVTLRRYLVDGKMHYANAGEPSLPEAIAPLVATIGGLNDFRISRKPRTLPRAQYTTSSGLHALYPGDMAVIYDLLPLYQIGIAGNGQKIAIVGQSDVRLSDIQAFRSAAGLPANSPRVILVPGSADPGYVDGDETESDLDLEWAGGLAPQASIVFVTSTDVGTSMEYAVSQNVAPVLSVSYGVCEQKVSGSTSRDVQGVAQQANAQGMTVLVSSGDQGAAACDTGNVSQAQYGLDVNALASPPEITGVGGTEFNEGSGRYWNTTNSSTGTSVLSYIPEKAWNDSVAEGGPVGTGGGVSAYFTRPAWQTGPGVPNDNARHVPDVALTASGDNDPYVISSEGSFIPIGGTSASAPSFAAIVALMNHYLVSTGKQSAPGLGNINPNLYRLAQTSPGIFHDVTVGSNIVPCIVGTRNCSTGQMGYATGPGYDMATGLGSVDAYKLITGWNATSVTATTTTASANPTSLAITASTTLTATVKAASGTLSPGGSVTFSAGNTTLGTAPLSGSGGTSTATLTLNGSLLSTGTNNLTVTYPGSSGFGSSSGSVSVTVTASSGGATTATLTANPASIVVTSTTLLTATVKASSGSPSPSGTVSFNLGNFALGTSSLSGSGGTATATFTVSGNQLSAGANSIFAVYAGGGGFGGSVASTVVTVTVPGTGTTTTVIATPPAIASTGNTVLTATVAAVSGVLSPTGSVSFALGGTTLGTHVLSGTGGSATASITVNGSQLAAGNNTITATFAGGSGFSGSTGTVTVAVTAPVSGTSTTAGANPPAITVSSSTVITATVRAASGSTSPGGQVAFNYGGATLATATLSGSGGSATASATIYGNRLAVGSNTVTVLYGGNQGFNPSSATVTVTVSIPTSSSAVIASVVPDPIYQQAADADGYSWFYTVRLTEIAGVSTTLTSFGIDSNDYTSSIAAWYGSNHLPARGTLSAALRTKLSSVPVTRVFNFTGKDANGTPWTQQITVPFLPQQISGSMTVSSTPGTVVRNPDGNPGCDTAHQFFFQDLNLQEQNGYPILLNKFLAAGNDYTANIPVWFGSWRLAPLGALQAGICWSIANPPTTISYELDGVDTAGNKIVTAASIPFNLQPTQSGGALSSSVNTVAMTAPAGQSATATVPVSLNSDQQWTASLFPANQKTSWLVVYPLSGSGPGTVNLVASAAGLSAGLYTATLVLQSVNTVPQFLNIPIRFTIGGSSNVTISGVANGASFQQSFAPGMILSVFGRNLANTTLAAPGVPLPYTLSGVSASLNGIPAPLYYVSPTQLNIQLPYETPARAAVLAVNNNGQVATFNLNVASAAPGIFGYAGSAVPVSSASIGQGVVFFITGEGDVSPYVDTGAPPKGAALTTPPKPRLALSMTLGGVPIAPIFVGIPSWSVGVTQVNFVIPPQVPAGPQPLVVTVGGVNSPPVNLTVQGGSANVQFSFNPSSVNQASDGAWHYTTIMKETNGVGVNLNNLTVFGKDYTGNLQSWFSATRIPPGGTLSGGFIATCTCSPPWDGTWQVSGVDDNGNTGAWSGVVHFLPPTTQTAISMTARRPLRTERGDAPDAAALPPESAEPVFESAAPALFQLLSNAGVLPLTVADGARNQAGPAPSPSRKRD